MLCAMAWDMNSLVIFRALQGLGGGMVQPVAMAITFTMITPIERGRFMVVLGLPILLGPILGPTVGGYLVEYISWRAIFLINVPIGVIALVLTQIMLKETEVKHQLKLDGLGFTLGLIAFPGVLLGLSEGSDQGWDSPFVLVLLGAGFTALAAFIIVELRHRDPLLQLKLFARPMFATGIFMTAVVQFCFFGSNVILPLFLQTAHGLGASRTGLILFPSAIMDFSAVLVTGRLYTRFGPRPFAIIGMSVLAVTAFSLSNISSDTNQFEIAALSSLRGLGMGLAMMPVSTMSFNTVPQELMGRATALQNVLQRIFGSASTAILTTILVLSLHSQGAPSGSTVTTPGLNLDFIVGSFSDAFVAMSIVACVGIVASFFLHDAVLEKHWAEQRAGPVKVVDQVEAADVSIGS
jgi:EmrB/QacA subfamily drug resistance transporter